MATKKTVGDKVYRKANPRHLGRIEAIRNSAFVRVRWKTTGWLEVDIPIRELVKVPKKNPIHVLKALAVKANEVGDFDMVKKIILQLEMCWEDDPAAQAFYTRLEQDADLIQRVLEAHPTLTRAEAVKQLWLTRCDPAPHKLKKETERVIA